jgi:hypothetical protein
MEGGGSLSRVRERAEVRVCPAGVAMHRPT